MRKHLIPVMALAVAMALSTVAPALAKGGPPEGRGPRVEKAEKAEKGRTLERGNWLSGIAEPVALTAADVTTGTLADGTDYVTVNHQIATDHDGYSTLVQREPVRYRQNVVTEDPQNYDSAWLGIAGPRGPEIAHQGEMHWYYEVGEGEWVSLTFEFDGRGDLVRVNDVHVE